VSVTVPVAPKSLFGTPTRTGLVTAFCETNVVNSFLADTTPHVPFTIGDSVHPVTTTPVLRKKVFEFATMVIDIVYGGTVPTENKCVILAVCANCVVVLLPPRLFWKPYFWAMYPSKSCRSCVVRIRLNAMISEIPISSQCERLLVTGIKDGSTFGRAPKRICPVVRDVDVDTTTVPVPGTYVPPGFVARE
jgi:hypothetical protein